MKKLIAIVSAIIVFAAWEATALLNEIDCAVATIGRQVRP